MKKREKKKMCEERPCWPTLRLGPDEVEPTHLMVKARDAWDHSLLPIINLFGSFFLNCSRYRWLFNYCSVVTIDLFASQLHCLNPEDFWKMKSLPYLYLSFIRIQGGIPKSGEWKLRSLDSSENLLNEHRYEGFYSL